MALGPGDALVLTKSGYFAALMGRFDAGVATMRRALVLDPLADISRSSLATTLSEGRKFSEAAEMFAEILRLNPGFSEGYGSRGLALLGLGDAAGARSVCEIKRDHWLSLLCQALAYEKLGQHADAQAALAKLVWRF